MSSKKKTILCQVSEEAIKLDDSDRISRLPEAMLQHILFFLPIEDAVPLSTVSKTWLSAWNSLPVLEFSFDHDQDGALKEFVTSIDDSLSTLKHRKAMIKSFSLKVTPSHEEGLDLDTHFDNWVSLIMKNYVKEINIRVLDSDITCGLPQALFASKSLVKLHLEGCRFPAKISINVDDAKLGFTNFNSLKEISLVNIVAQEEEVQKLINFSRAFLERLTIKMSPSVETLNLDQFMKLSFVEANIKKFRVQAPNLVTLVLYGVKSLNAYDCGNIRTLKCLTWDRDPNAYKSIRELISKLPVLETLQLFMSRYQKIQIQNRHLTTLLLFEGQRFQQPIKVELHTPRLKTIYFNGLSIPFVTMFSPNRKLKLHHFGHPAGGIDGSHLHQLGKFSQNLFRPSVRIHLHQIFTENVLTLEQLKEHPVVYHPANVRMLVLECIPFSADYPSFLNSLFWSCHPNALLVLMASEETLYSVHRDLFLQSLCNELLDRDENPTCCTERNKPKCWRHYLANVEVSVYRSMPEFEKPVDLPPQLAGNLISVTDTKTKGIFVDFRFQWLPYPVLYVN